MSGIPVALGKRVQVGGAAQEKDTSVGGGRGMLAFTLGSVPVGFTSSW